MSSGSLAHVLTMSAGMSLKHPQQVKHAFEETPVEYSIRILPGTDTASGAEPAGILPLPGALRNPRESQPRGVARCVPSFPASQACIRSNTAS